MLTFWFNPDKREFAKNGDLVALILFCTSTEHSVETV